MLLEETVHASEGFHLLFNKVPQPLWVYDEETLAFLAVNDAAIATYGYGREEFLSMTLMDIRPAADTRILIEHLAKEDSLRDQVFWRHKTKDGTILHVEIKANSVEFGGKRARLVLSSKITVPRDAEAEMAELLIQLQDQKRRIDNIVASVPGVVWEAWGEPAAEAQRIDFVSNYVEEMLGYKVEEWLSTPNFWLSIVHPDDREEAAREAAALYRSGRGGVHSMRWMTRDGRALWIESHLIVMCDAAGNPFGLRGVSLDISERKRAEEALRKSEEDFRRYFDLGLIGMAITSPTKGFIEANDQMCSMLGYDHDELLQLKWPELTHPDDLEADIENFTRVLAHEIDGYSMEKRFIRKDGQIIDTTIALKPILSDDGSIDRFVAIMQDITERKRAEKEMIRLIAAVEQTADSIVITDTEGLIEYVNPAFERISGYTKAEVAGQTCRVLKSGQMGKDVYEELWSTIKGGEVWTGHLINRRKDGSLYQEQATISPVRNSSGEIINFVAVKQDITQRVQLEDQFLQSQKMEAVGKLAGGVAHDFNNLLTAITGYSDLTMRKLQSEDPLRHNLEQIKRAGDRAAGLTRQLLAFSRKQVLQPKVLSLNTIVSDLSKMLQRLIGEDIQLETSLEPALGTVKADPGQIEQVIMNLAVNSRDAMPDGGKLMIETGNVFLDQAYISRHVSITPGHYVLIAVSDNGAGMDEKTRQRIFEPFFTTKESGKGTGLGLSTVYGIVKQSGGNIWVYSEVGQGTTFKVYLPRIDEPLEVQPLRAIDPGMLQGVETVLLVEDEEMVRKLARQILETCGYKVLEAPHGGAALLLCERHDGPLHLMLTDVVMPEMSGRELMQRLSPIRPEMRVLFMSGYTEHAIVYHGVVEAETHFIQKPFTPEALARKVREVLDERRQVKKESVEPALFNTPVSIRESSTN
jgi:PAS domain S-box-containing protein